MSRTYRNTVGMHKCAFRYPKTANEIKQINGIINDDEIFDYNISKLNHMKSRGKNLPTCWDDMIVSAYYQQDYAR